MNEVISAQFFGLIDILFKQLCVSQRMNVATINLIDIQIYCAYSLTLKILLNHL